MKPDHVSRLLQSGLADLGDARRHLDYSFSQIERLPGTLTGATEAQLESVEAFTGRFARVVDLLVNKVLRSLDRMELKPEGTLLDVVNRAEQRGFVNRSADLREMKDVRNVIAHDYAGARAAEIFVYCRSKSPFLTLSATGWLPMPGSSFPRRQRKSSKTKAAVKEIGRRCCRPGGQRFPVDR